MRILIVHNEYGKFSGEEAVVAAQVEMLRSRGHRVFRFRKSSAGLDGTLIGQAKAFFSGVYNPSSSREIRQLLGKCRPDIVHIHNLYPWISPAILPECRRAGVPVVMTVHNYRLVCPNGLHMPKGRYEICEKCCAGREYWCVLRNCERNYSKSVGYALRNYTARRFGFFTRNVTLFVCLTEFQRRRLVAEGYPADRLRVAPNMCDCEEEPVADVSRTGDFAAYVGRVSPEKGIELLLKAAEKLPSIPFRLAGNCDAMPHVAGTATANVLFLGPLDRRELGGLYGRSRFLMLCSTWFEGFPMAILEAMTYSKPVIAPRIGGISEIVDDGRTGLLFSPGNADELAERVRYLWDRPDLCRQMGRAGREKVLREYTPAVYYERLMALYGEAIEFATADLHREAFVPSSISS